MRRLRKPGVVRRSTSSSYWMVVGYFRIVVELFVSRGYQSIFKHWKEMFLCFESIKNSKYYNDAS